MLSACAASPGLKPAPVVELKTVVRVECPVDVLLPLPARIEPATDAVLHGNQAGMDYLVAKQIREDMLAARLTDAATECGR